MSDEVNEKVEVSSNIEDVVAVAPATVSPEGTPASPVMIACKQCGAPFERKGPNSKFCPECAPQQAKMAQQNRKERKKTATFVFDSKVEASKADALSLLKDWGLQNGHVLDFC